MALLLSERLLPAAGCFNMETPQDYRKFAEECRRLARRAEDAQHKAILEEMAEVWLRLAAEAEQKGSRQAD